MTDLPEKWQWFPRARFGLFIHWGPYSRHGRGEQVLFREHLDQCAYQQRACQWRPQHFDAAQWAHTARAAGMRYAVMTARHHDGFCMWDSSVTDYTSVRQAAERDFIAEYVEAFRAAGLRVGLYYSLADWRIPAYWEGPDHDPDGWQRFVTYVHAQVEELVTRYGEIDVLWFDGAWPHDQSRWRSAELVDMIRRHQPDILINNRLGAAPPDAEPDPDGGVGAGKSILGDFGTPEHQIRPEHGRLWESCQVTTWRLWGYAIGERWRSAARWLDMLIECVARGGNLLLNVGPRPDGTLPPQFVERAETLGRWMDVHGDIIYGADPGEVCEFITYGRQLRRGNHLYLVIRFWDGRPTMTVGGLATRVKRARLVTTGQELVFRQTSDHLTLEGLPRERPTPLFPVIDLEFEQPPRPCQWAKDRLWSGDPRRMTEWARQRGESVWVDGRWRD